MSGKRARGLAGGAGGKEARRRGSILIIVLWISFGLIALTLYFAHAMALEFRAADNHVAGMEADRAIEGAMRYVSNVLAQLEIRGVLPETNQYPHAAVPVGDAAFWLIGRGEDAENLPARVHFGLVDEAAKLNLNSVTVTQMVNLSRMTAELAAAIVDWRDTDETVSDGGMESEGYARRNPAYRCKNSPFESVAELRLVNGAFLELLFGEDTNLNGALDLPENDGVLALPIDNSDGRLEPGLFEYFTIYSREPTTTTNGAARLDVNAANFQQQLAPLLQTALGAERANAVLRALAPGGRPGGNNTARFGSVLEWYIRSGLSADEFAPLEDQLRNPRTNGLVNVNTASAEVLACIPGIGLEKAAALVAQRQGQSRPRTSVAWVKEALDETSAIQAGPYLTGRGYQYSADVAAVGRFGRGYRRVRFVFDVASGTPRVIYRQDLTHLGWALGRQARSEVLALAQTRP